MSQEAVERVLGRLLTDDAFRERAARELAAACRDEGYPLSEEELAAIRSENIRQLEAAAGKIDSSIKRFTPGRG